jgi:antagonist of KipI
MFSIQVIKPGLLTTVQDGGRWGWQHFGVSPAGPMDRLSHRLANRLVGNPDEAATLEVTVIGPTLQFEAPAVVSVAGATFQLSVGGRPLMSTCAFAVEASARLSFGERRRGTRAYVAIAGGIDTEPVLGSRSTHLPSRLGGIQGRPLRAGDVLGFSTAAWRPAPGPRHRGQPVVQLPDGGARLRVLLGPQEDFFTARSLERLQTARYVIDPQSNRMGYRLTGEPLHHVGAADILSEPVCMGSVQVPASGQPLLLMADCPTTGGYPRIATVITADLPLAGQLAPGDWVEFVACDYDQAGAALEALERDLAFQAGPLRGTRPTYAGRVPRRG